MLPISIDIVEYNLSLFHVAMHIEPKVHRSTGALNNQIQEHIYVQTVCAARDRRKRDRRLCSVHSIHNNRDQFCSFIYMDCSQLQGAPYAIYYSKGKLSKPSNDEDGADI